MSLDLQLTPLIAAAAGHFPLGPTSLPHQTCPDDPSWCLEVLWDNCEGVPGLPIAPHWPKDSGGGLHVCCMLEWQCVSLTSASSLCPQFTFPSSGGTEALSDPVSHHSCGAFLLSALCVINRTLMLTFLVGVIAIGFILSLSTLSQACP